MSTQPAPSSSHWLFPCVQTLHPESRVPAGVEISPDLSEAWRQVATICQITPLELAACVAQAFGLQVGSIARFQPTDASLLPERFCREHKIVQLRLDEHSACFAVADPRLSSETTGRLRFAAARPVELVVLPPDEIDTCLTRLFASPAAGSADRTHVINLLANEAESEAAPLARLARAVLRQAIEAQASDIHIHPFVGGGAIRFRVDGRLTRIATLPKEALGGLSRYFKAQAGLEPNPLKPQDGRLRLAHGHREIDVRLSILPAYDGDRIVCRLLDQGRDFSLQHSRFSAADQQTLHRLTAHSAGMVLMTGPTGSGKTSTLYALLNELNAVDVNIMTLEDPVEYVLPGISQIQVNEKQGLSFAEALRSVLRQDPDIVLVGEIRDAETARIAMQAALTGHLVLSTLHTNDALATLPRLRDLGLDATVLADALLGVVSQRLVRRLCPACRQPATAPLLPAEAEFQRITGEAPAFRPGGCAACHHTGYRGRLPVIESLENSPALRQAIAAGEQRPDALAQIAGSHRRSVAASARDWIVSGETTPAEVQQALGLGFWRELAAEHGIAPETLSANLAQAAEPAARMRILLLSRDADLATRLAASLDYAVERVDDADAAAAHLQAHHDVIGLAIDARLAEGPTAAWLTQLRTRLAWAGLPGLFLTGPQDTELQSLLAHFGAPQAPRDTADATTWREAITLMLQGRA